MGPGRRSPEQAPEKATMIERPRHSDRSFVPCSFILPASGRDTTGTCSIVEGRSWKRSCSLLQGAPAAVPPTMGRRKIEMVPIPNDRHRNVTFSKRKGGLIRKATELSVLCGANVSVLVFGANQKATMYSSGPFDEMLKRFSEYDDVPEVRDLRLWRPDPPAPRRAAGHGRRTRPQGPALPPPLRALGPVRPPLQARCRSCGCRLARAPQSRGALCHTPRPRPTHAPRRAPCAGAHDGGLFPGACAARGSRKRAGGAGEAAVGRRRRTALGRHVLRMRGQQRRLAPPRRLQRPARGHIVVLALVAAGGRLQRPRPAVFHSLCAGRAGRRVRQPDGPDDLRHRLWGPAPADDAAPLAWAGASGQRVFKRQRNVPPPPAGVWAGG